MSDPQVAVDIGSFLFKLNPVSINSTIQFGYDYGMLNVTVLNVTFNSAEKGSEILFEGVSDMSDYFSEAITFSLNTVINRAKSLSRYNGTID